jgi:hypothetical protein
MSLVWLCILASQGFLEIHLCVGLRDLLVPCLLDSVCFAMGVLTSPVEHPRDQVYGSLSFEVPVCPVSLCSYCTLHVVAHRQYWVVQARVAHRWVAVARAHLPNLEYDMCTTVCTGDPEVEV